MRYKTHEDIDAEGLAPPASYGLIEGVGQSRTAVDQSDGDDAYFELCSELYGGIWAKVFMGSPRESTRTD